MGVEAFLGRRLRLSGPGRAWGSALFRVEGFRVSGLGV